MRKLVFVLTMLLLASSFAQADEVDEACCIDAEGFQHLQQERQGDLAILDVRSQMEFEYAHLPGSINVPDGQFRSNYDEAIKKLPTDKPLVIVCVGGIRAKQVYDIIAENGHDNLQQISALEAHMIVEDDGDVFFK